MSESADSGDAIKDWGFTEDFHAVRAVMGYSPVMELPPYETLVTLLEHVDAFAVVEHLQALGTPPAVSEAYDQLLRDAYWEHKDLRMVMLLGTAGIYYNIAHAKLAADDAAREAFKSAAKRLAYNMGSFSWPGWDEAGITITKADRVRGLEAARLNLRLALELQKPFDKVRAGAWLVGAQLLSAGEIEEALFQFRYALPEKTDKEYGLFSGYVLLAEVILGMEGAEARWEAHLKELAAAGTEDAKFAEGQLATAHRVFAAPGR